MLLIKNTLKTICSRSFIATFCIAVISSLLIFAFAMDKQNAPLELSHRDMKGIIGGGYCCDNCDDIDEWYDECYHSQPYPTAPNCDQDLTKCIHNELVTASCERDQHPDAAGCDTSTYSPVTYELHQDLYQVANCSWSSSTWEVHRVTYYGCDTGDIKHCDDHTIVKTCLGAGAMCCAGTWLSDDDKGITRKQCGGCT